MKNLLPKFWANVVKLPLWGMLCLIAAPSYAIDIKEVRSPGGIKAWLVQDKSIPVISVNFAFKTGGTAYDPVGKEGLARMVSAMLDEGGPYAKLYALQFASEGTTVP